MVVGIYRRTVLQAPKSREGKKEKRNQGGEGRWLGVEWHIGISQADVACMGMAVDSEQAQ